MSNTTVNTTKDCNGVEVKVGDTIEIAGSRQSVPGFGGLNFNSLAEDGWKPGMVLTVLTVGWGGDVEASWGEGLRQSRWLWPNEFKRV